MMMMCLPLADNSRGGAGGWTRGGGIGLVIPRTVLKKMRAISVCQFHLWISTMGCGGSTLPAKDVLAKADSATAAVKPESAPAAAPTWEPAAHETAAAEPTEPVADKPATAADAPVAAAETQAAETPVRVPPPRPAPPSPLPTTPAATVPRLTICRPGVTQVPKKRKPVVGANWKCNPDSKSKLDELIANMNLCDTSACDVYICPSTLHVDCTPLPAPLAACPALAPAAVFHPSRPRLTSRSH